MNRNILEVSHLHVHFPVRAGVLSRQKGTVKAVDDVSFTIAAGETLGLVGESGCGKSTIGRAIVRLLEPTDGHIRLDGRDFTHRSQWRLGSLRRKVQMVFQDPAASMNPRMDVEHIIQEPLNVQKLGKRSERRERVRQLIDLVGLPSNAASKFPHEFSGGQRQRIAIARALAQEPKLLILDEPVSALDVSVQSLVLNLLLDLQKELGLAYLFISHDLSVVNHMSDRVAVMYLGKIVEMADAERIYNRPRHEYTRALLASVPQPDPHHINHAHILPGEVPSPIDPPPGSAFGRRINHPYLETTYGMDLTPMEIEPGHWVAPDPCALSMEDLQKLKIDIYR